MTEDNATTCDQFKITSGETWRLREAAEAMQQANAYLQNAQRVWTSELAAALDRSGRTPETLKERWVLAVDGDDVYLRSTPNGHPEEEISPD